MNSIHPDSSGAPSDDAPPFAGLAPERVLGAPIIGKFYRPKHWSHAAILEEHVFVASLAAREIPAVLARVLEGATLHEFDGFRFSVFERRGGRAPDLDRSDTLEWLGRFIGRIHAVGAIEPYRERPDARYRNLRLRAARLAADARLPSRRCARSLGNRRLDGARRRRAILRARGRCAASASARRLPSEQCALDRCRPPFRRFRRQPHGSCLQDLWLLLPAGRADASRALTDLLAGYEDFCEFDPRELHLIEALRTLRLIHYSAWLARRWNDPAFPWFNTQRYWEDRILELREQVGAMQEGPLWPV